jgi:hypothetical protein
MMMLLESSGEQTKESEMVSEKDDVQQMLRDALCPEIDAIEDSGVFVVNLIDVLGLVNHIPDDPVTVSALLLQYQTAFKILEASLQSSVEKLYNVRREINDRYVDLYSTADTKNPLHLKKKLTDQNVKSSVGVLPQYKQIMRELVRHQVALLKIRAIRESIDSTVYLVRTLISKTNIPASGTILSVTELTDQMKALKQHIEKLVPSDFTRYYIDENVSEDPD